MVVARAVLVPGGVAREGGRAQQLARCRTVLGFVCIAALSIDYRAVDDTADDALGNFNKSVPVALAVFVGFVVVLQVFARGDARARLRRELPAVWGRVGKFVAVIVGTWGAMVLIGVDSPTASPEQAKLGLLVFFGFVGLYGMGCWCISCHWFGIGRAHPLLPPLVAATTVLVMTSMELHLGEPDPLPPRLWLLINFAAVITTFGVCFVEICDARAAPESPADDPVAEQPGWPVAAAATLVILTLAGSALLVGTGTAERVLCDGRPPLVNCGDRIDLLADRREE